MGVTGLWTVVAPTARPTKLETLNRKRLAVDASIWIYQFLKAVRDKEGNALRNSHVVGFFRRICKLLYFGIKPVFVFDGGAPVLKRETVRQRARRREGRREDAAKTAGKLLALQVARAAEEEEKRRRDERAQTPQEELPPDEELVYVEEIGMSAQERRTTRGFKRKDQYHLPDLDVSIESLGAPNDPRIMSQAELEEYARHFHSGEDINLYDFSKIDFESPFFLSLPAGDRYNILNAARLRSRLRMGYSKEQLDGMFPDRMAFSRFQIERVKERNELTQRLMHINGMAEDSWDQGGRIVGEKGKEYVLVKNDGVEGGWALGVVSNKKGTKREDAIDLEDEERSEDADEESDEGDFEDVAIEGLNRLPKSMRRKRRDLRDTDFDDSYEDAAAQIARKRQAVYAARKKAADTKPAPAAEIPAATDTLFVPEDKGDSDDEGDLFEDVDIAAPNVEEDDDLQRAIAMSLEQPEEQAGGFVAEDNLPPAGQDDEMDLAAALAESRKSKYQSTTNVRKQSPPRAEVRTKFDGPLPFESLNLGQSLLGKKKAKKVEEDMAGGFDRDAGEEAFRKKKKAQPMPSWFDTVPQTNDLKTWEEPEDEEEDHVTLGREDIDRRETLQRHRTKEVIDLEAEDADEQITNTTGADIAVPNGRQELYKPVEDDDIPDDMIVAEEEPEDDSQEQAEREKAAREREQRYEIGREIAAANEVEDPVENDITVEGATEDTTMEDVAQHVRAEPPSPSHVPRSVPNFQPEAAEETNEAVSDHGDDVEWSDSDVEDDHDGAGTLSESQQPAGGHLQSKTSDKVSHDKVEEDEDEDEEFEDVEMGPVEVPEPLETDKEQTITEDYLIDASTVQEQQAAAEDEENYLSDSDEEIMRQLAIEAEEHARFASELNNIKTPAQAARDYENELKQLRNQQKKDRRDADEVTQVMIQECQALLRLFGLPYMTAPMEAEAQCAELVHLGLVDGIVTDDSDIFLFGGTRIYKNMFNAAKFVECYVSADLEKEYALDRKKLIRFAHLLGSDYTEGIPGIGPVTALEIISDFDTLQDFKDWCAKVQLGRPSDLENQLTTSFRRKFKRTVQKRLFLPNAFPDVRVDQAYLNPDVDADPQEFQWGVPDLEKLRSFLMATIGWSQDRTDEILVPVIRDMNKRDQEGTQANITRFFGGAVGVGAVNSEGTAPRNRTGKESGRMKNAYTRLRGEAKKRKVTEDNDSDGDYAGDGGAEGDERAVTKPADDLDGDEDVDAGDEAVESVRKVTKRRKTKAGKA